MKFEKPDLDWYNKTWTYTPTDTLQTELNSYIFKSKKLEWINLDRFVGSDGVDYFLPVKYEENQNITIIYDNIKSVLRPETINNQYIIKNSPKNQAITIIIIKKQDGLYYLSKIKTNTNVKKLKAKPEFKQIKDLKKELKFLD